MQESRGIINAFTVDFEDWYQGLEIIGIDQWSQFESRIHIGAERLLHLLKDFNVKATFFVLGYIAERYPALVRQIAEEGHEIGVHSYAHQLVYRQTEREFREDLRRSISVIEDAVGKPVYGYRAPFFSITPKSLWALDILVEQGIRFDSSIFPIWNYRYGFPSADVRPFRIKTNRGLLLEIPISCPTLKGFRLPVNGGAYLRILPYKVLAWGIRRVHQLGCPAVIYIHPWELDPDHPVLDLPKRIGLTHYIKLSSTLPKLRQLLTDFCFAPMGLVYREYLTPQHCRSENEGIS